MYRCKIDKWEYQNGNHKRPYNKVSVLASYSSELLSVSVSFVLFKL